jgi:hypothetical protein
MDKMHGACGDKLLTPNSLWSGKEGHLRLAREIGYALHDFSVKEQSEILKSSYSKIYVRACGLKPLLNAKEWIKELIKGRERGAV